MSLVSPDWRDGDVQRVRVDDRAAVAELAGRLGVGGDAGQLLDQGRAHLARVVGGAAAEELDPLDVAQLAGVQVDAAELRGGEPLVQAAHDSARRMASGCSWISLRM